VGRSEYGEIVGTKRWWHRDEASLRFARVLLCKRDDDSRGRRSEREKERQTLYSS
jgi:hypothetical protein